jgi:hypothetical protein
VISDTDKYREVISGRMAVQKTVVQTDSGNSTPRHDNCLYTVERISQTRIYLQNQAVVKKHTYHYSYLCGLCKGTFISNQKIKEQLYLYKYQ